MSILTRIIEDKRRELAGRKRNLPLQTLGEQALLAPTPPSMSKALRMRRPGIIAEVKRKSPSAGPIREPFDPAAIARAYAAAGASGISVLMDTPYFGGGEQDFDTVAACVDVPLLYKEFVVDEWQIWHARLHGAAAVLLIVAALSPTELSGLYEKIQQADMEALIEVHDAEELRVALALNPTLVGVNNRNLKTFDVSLDVTYKLASQMPADVTFISESGIRSPHDLVQLRDAGVHGVLVGEQLLRQPDPGRAVNELMELVWNDSP